MGVLIVKSPIFYSFVAPSERQIHIYTFNQELLTEKTLEVLRSKNFGAQIFWHVLKDSHNGTLKQPGFLISSDREAAEVFEIKENPDLAKKLAMKIHPDFLTKGTLKTKVIPLFWKIDKDRRLNFLQVIPVGDLSVSEMNLGIEILLQARFQKIFLDHLDLKTTLLEFENLPINPNQKASALRFVSFKK